MAGSAKERTKKSLPVSARENHSKTAQAKNACKGTQKSPCERMQRKNPWLKRVLKQPSQNSARNPGQKTKQLTGKTTAKKRTETAPAKECTETATA